MCLLCRKGVSEVADWLTVQWLLVVKSWALAEVVVWLKFEVGTVDIGLCSKINFEHETQRIRKETKVKE